ncbi:MAG: class I SAM-dependent methyltransferase [Kiloniellales bacterium]|nr:class I SAM-dependent methyltransferase [Kiloniellales bacterium]
MTGLYTKLAAAYVRGSLSKTGHSAEEAELLSLGRAAGLKLHRFKRTMDLPRVRAVLGILRGIGPASLLDIGSGRGTFLWPLLDAFPELAVTAVERDDRRRTHLDAVRRGGIERLSVVGGEASALPFPDRAFDIVTLLEVLEHQRDPAPLAQEAVRLAGRFLIASVPSKPDENPEHVQLFSGESLSALLRGVGAAKVAIDYVPNHIVAVARTYQR